MDNTYIRMGIYQKSRKTFETYIVYCQFISALRQSYLFNIIITAMMIVSSTNCDYRGFDGEIVFH